MQIFFNVHLIVDLCCLVLFQFYRKAGVNFCPFYSLMFKHLCFHVKLLTSLASCPFAQECSFAHDKKLFLLLEQGSYARLTWSLWNDSMNVSPQSISWLPS